MGDIIRSECKCGYGGQFCVGFGMIGPSYVGVICHCKKCKNLQVINGFKKIPISKFLPFLKSLYNKVLNKPTLYICETCNEYLSLIRRSDDGRFESILCPKCEEHTLEFQYTGGIWD